MKVTVKLIIYIVFYDFQLEKSLKFVFKIKPQHGSYKDFSVKVDIFEYVLEPLTKRESAGNPLFSW